MGRKRVYPTTTLSPNSGDKSMVKPSNVNTAGIIHKIYLENFLCHSSLEIAFNEKINFIIGKNGSGKSAILTGLQVALGERASSTSRGNRMTDLVKTGRSEAKVRVTLTNGGPKAFMPEVYGDYLIVERIINASGVGGGYRIISETGIVISKKKKDLDRILAQMNLQVDNPVCILTQEVAKNFLHGNDSKGKYKLFERAIHMDAMKREFSEGEENLKRSKTCVKDKKESLQLQTAELQKYKAMKQWYEDLDVVQDKKNQIKSMIQWAKVEISEKTAETALTQLENLQADIERVRQKKVEFETKLNDTKETYRTRTDDVTGQAQQIREMKVVQEELRCKYESLTNNKNQIQAEIRCLDADRKRLERDKVDCEKSIEERKRAIRDSDWARRNQSRLVALAQLKEREEELVAQKKMSERQVEQIQGAVNQLRNEITRNDTGRLQRDLDGKTRSLNNLRRAEGNYHAVFGDWVPALLSLIERTDFSGPKPKGPLGAFIKVKDAKWAPVVEFLLGDSLFKFICANDSDAQVLYKLVDQVMDGNAIKRPKIVASTMTGRVFDVSNNKVECHHLNEKGIFCLLDMLIIEDADVANMLIDIAHIDQVLVIQEDRDARYYLSDASNVPKNCKSAITRKGNKYNPDPDYKTYGEKVRPSASYLQVSVDDVIRNLEQEISVVRPQLEKANQINRDFDQQLKQNEEQLHLETSSLDKTRQDLFSIAQEKLALETQAEPGPTDVAALEEDVLDIDNKITANMTEREAKLVHYEDVNQLVKETKTAKMEKDRAVADLIAQTDPLRDSLDHMKAKEAKCKSAIKKLEEKLASLQKTLKDYEEQHIAARERVKLDTTKAESLAPRMSVTKSLKSLKLELKQITEQVAAREEEFGSKEEIFAEYEKRVKDVQRSRLQLANVQKSTLKMIEMSKRRKRFLKKFRQSMEIHTHRLFQEMLEQKGYEGGIEFNNEEMTLNLQVTPPGRLSGKKKSGKTGIDIRSLSGGERSFATVCFILSLWGAIESPIRVLDEFDVFMDHVNRDFSMELLLNEARSSVGRQFIFLTPLGLDQEIEDPDITIWRMGDPVRP